MPVRPHRPTRSLRRMAGMVNHGPDHLMVLGLVAIVLIGAFVIYPKVQAVARATTTHDQLTVIAHKLDTSLASSWTTESAQKAGVFPVDMLSPSFKGPFDVWGGKVTLESRPNEEGTIVTLMNVPVLDCVKLMGHVPISWPRVLVNGHEVSGDVARANACLGRENEDTNTIAFVHPKT